MILPNFLKIYKWKNVFNYNEWGKPIGTIEENC